MADRPLTEWFLEALPRSRQPASSDALEAALAAALGAARQAHPGLQVTDAAFVRHLASCAETAEAIASLQAPDLLLAFACARGDGGALAELSRRIGQVVPLAVSRLRSNPAFLEEVGQLLSQRLLVPAEGATPRILDFRGKGPIERWLRAAALRVALNLLESDKTGKEQGESAIRGLADDGPDPELSHLRRRYAPQFKEAVELALRGLSAKERNFLRLYFVEGLTVEQIGAMEGSHKSTISRWLARSRETVVTEVRRHLGKQLKLSDSELDSLMGLLQSQLELSLLRVL
jgi:RNA polymerase sigma-70 factor (ECF subfamily)